MATSDYDRREREKLDLQRKQVELQGQQVKLQAEETRAARASAAAHADMAAASWHQAQAQAEASMIEAAAAARLAEQQGEAAIAASVGQLSLSQIANVDAYKKLNEDRRNTQVLFDDLGDCIACIEQDGKPTATFDLTPIPAERESGDRKAHSGVYRYTNLNAACTRLVDLREEVSRIRNWDAERSREDTLARIELYLQRGRESAKAQARRAYRETNAERKMVHGIAIGSFVIGQLVNLIDSSGDFGLLGLLGINVTMLTYVWYWLRGKAKPPNLDDLKELAGE